MSNDYKYLKDGRKVVVVGHLNSQELIVQEVFVSKQTGQEFPGGENFTVKSVLDEPVESWKEKETRKIEQNYETLKQQYERERDTTNREIAKVKHVADYFRGLARNFDTDQLGTLIDFLEGRINWVLFTGYSPKIVSIFDDDMYQRDSWGMGRGSGRFEALKLITLYGSSKGQLDFRLNRYSDGSGGDDSVLLFETKEEAVAMAQILYDDKAKLAIAGQKANIDFEKWEKNIPEIVPNKTILKMRAQKKIESNNKRLVKLREEMSALESEQVILESSIT